MQAYNSPAHMPYDDAAELSKPVLGSGRIGLYGHIYGDTHALEVSPPSSL